MFLRLLTIAAFASAAAGPAFAGAAFRYSPAELHSDSGRSAVYERLRATADAFCTIESRRSLKAFRREKACVTEISGIFVDKIGDADLSALHIAEVTVSE